MMQMNLEPRYVEQLLNYLAGRPWGEVQALIPPLAQELESAAKKQAQEQAGMGAGEANGAQVIPMGPGHGKTAES